MCPVYVQNLFSIGLAPSFAKDLNVNLKGSLRKVLQRKLRMCIENSFGHCEMINDYAMKKIGKMVPHLLREKSWTNRGKTN